MSAIPSKLFDPPTMFDHPMTVGIVIAIVAALALAPLIIFGLDRSGRLGSESRRELWARYRTWLVLAPLMVGPILLGPGSTMIAVGVLGLLCHREFARATGLFRQRAISATVVVGIIAVTFAAMDHWYGLFVALPSLMVAVIAVIGLLPDQPRGYLQRSALGVLSFLLFGVCLGHLGYSANDDGYRPVLICILLCVELNDIFAYLTGKALGRRKLAPNTSPNKTIGGALGALVLTTTLFALLGHLVFRGGSLDTPVHLITMGMLLSIGGQLGDLVISSVKRDLGVKDLGAALPGHGGLLDRFDSLLLVAPALFHYIVYFQGFGLEQQTRIITG